MSFASLVVAAGIGSISMVNAALSMAKASKATPGHPKAVNRKAKQKMAVASRRSNRKK